MDELTDSVFFELCSCDELGILEIHLILFVIAVIGKFRITRDCQFSYFIRSIGDI